MKLIFTSILVPAPTHEEDVRGHPYAQIHKQGMNSYMKCHFMDKFIKYIEFGIEGEKIPVPAKPIELRRAILDQNLIGTDKLLHTAILLNHGQKLCRQQGVQKNTSQALCVPC
jgi:hypothetical protein